MSLNISKTSGMNLGPFFIAFAAFLWTTDTFARTNLEGLVTSTQIVMIEHVIIALVISPFIIKYMSRFKEFSPKEWFAVLFIGIGGSSLATIFLTEGFFIGYPFQFVAIVVLLQQTQPLIAITFAHLFLKEKLPKFFYQLALFSLFGVFLIIFPYFYSIETGSFGLLLLTDNLGLIAGILGLSAGFLWGSSTVFGRYMLKHGKTQIEFKEMTAFRFFIGAIFLAVFIPILPLGGYPTLENIIDPVVFISIMYIALIVGLFSLILYYFGLKTTHASVSAISELAYPLSFFVLIPILKLTLPEPIQLLGGLILIIGTTLLSYNYGKMEVEIGETKSEPTLT